MHVNLLLLGLLSLLVDFLLLKLILLDLLNVFLNGVSHLDQLHQPHLIFMSQLLFWTLFLNFLQFLDCLLVQIEVLCLLLHLLLAPVKSLLELKSLCFGLLLGWSLSYDILSWNWWFWIFRRDDLLLLLIDEVLDVPDLLHTEFVDIELNKSSILPILLHLLSRVCLVHRLEILVFLWTH